MEIGIYGFNAKVAISEGWLVGEIEELHLVDQAKTLGTLEKRLKKGFDTIFEAARKNPTKYKKYLSAQTLKKLGVKEMAYA
ncbi:MAG: hypothetical protein KGH53_00350 [Candidatus Micrarchaeota archaeon]|nr:hypothetical protein [Candidatus Micrarchaeota archaeon]